MAEADVVREIRTRLEEIADPCSMATAEPVSIVELGLVRGIEVDDKGDVEVTIAPTSPGCMVLPRIAEAVHDAASGVPGVHEVEVRVDHGFMWSQEAMAPEARLRLSTRRERMVRELEIRPRQWKSAPAARSRSVDAHPGTGGTPSGA